jgi:hypothetical protein
MVGHPEKVDISDPHALGGTEGVLTKNLELLSSKIEARIAFTVP